MDVHTQIIKKLLYATQKDRLSWELVSKEWFPNSYTKCNKEINESFYISLKDYTIYIYSYFWKGRTDSGVELYLENIKYNFSYTISRKEILFELLNTIQNKYLNDHLENIFAEIPIDFSEIEETPEEQLSKKLSKQ